MFSFFFIINEKVAVTSTLTGQEEDLGFYMSLETRDHTDCMKHQIDGLIVWFGTL